ncbi:hypothetical protein GZH46_00680 [Fragariocoptes setiger]|uniref:Uncharacterized protein n=1 Tax=Fragariocoptes setiger TaxID=1670756 RepID=A0ABQ7SBZ5_9ACAR|nr:hypothetical protein GZH46_00680 [Fragariocoptes setiger]
MISKSKNTSLTRHCDKLLIKIIIVAFFLHLVSFFNCTSCIQTYTNYNNNANDDNSDLHIDSMHHDMSRPIAAALLASSAPSVRTVNPGDRVNIPCSLANPGGSIQFAKDDQPIILDSGCTHCQLDISNDGQASLTINRVSSRDEGHWQCWRLDENGNVKQKIPIIQLIVTNSPELPVLLANDKELIGNDATISIKENEIITFQCVIRGASPSIQYVHWMLDGTQNITHQSQLTMEYSPNDSNYLTRSFLHLNATKTMNLNREPGFGLPISEGMSVMLKCEIDSNPASQPMWIKDVDKTRATSTAASSSEKQLSQPSSSGQTSDTPALLNTQDDGSVIFSPVTRQDSGWYRCKTENKYGNFSSFGYYLNVRPPHHGPPEASTGASDASVGASSNPSVSAMVGTQGQRPPRGPNGSTANSSSPPGVNSKWPLPGSGNLNSISTSDCNNVGAPVIDQPNLAVTGVLGRPLSLSVRFCCNPRPKRIFWIHRHLAMTPGRIFGPYVTRELWTTYKSLYCYVSTFDIEAVKLDDIGTVYFVVGNDKGLSDAQIQINLTRASEHLIQSVTWLAQIASASDESIEKVDGTLRIRRGSYEDLVEHEPDIDYPSDMTSKRPKANGSTQGRGDDNKVQGRSEKECGVAPLNKYEFTKWRWNNSVANREWPSPFIDETYAPDGAWPWQVAIMFLQQSPLGRGLHCSGTLLSARHVLTSSQCFGKKSNREKWPDAAKEMVVVAGTHSFVPRGLYKRSVQAPSEVSHRERQSNSDSDTDSGDNDSTDDDSDDSRAVDVNVPNAEHQGDDDDNNDNNNNEGKDDASSRFFFDWIKDKFMKKTTRFPKPLPFPTIVPYTTEAPDVDNKRARTTIYPLPSPEPKRSTVRPTPTFIPDGDDVIEPVPLPTRRPRTTRAPSESTTRATLVPTATTTTSILTPTTLASTTIIPTIIPKNNDSTTTKRPETEVELSAIDPRMKSRIRNVYDISNLRHDYVLMSLRKAIDVTPMSRSCCLPPSYGRPNKDSEFSCYLTSWNLGNERQNLLQMRVVPARCPTEPKRETAKCYKHLFTSENREYYNRPADLGAPIVCIDERESRFYQLGLVSGIQTGPSIVGPRGRYCQDPSDKPNNDQPRNDNMMPTTSQPQTTMVVTYYEVTELVGQTEKILERFPYDCKNDMTCPELNYKYQLNVG